MTCALLVQTLDMTLDLTQSFREMLSETEWIDGETRRLALHKLDAMRLRIGYPDFVLDREALNERYMDVSVWFGQTQRTRAQLASLREGRPPNVRKCVMYYGYPVHV